MIKRTLTITVLVPENLSPQDLIEDTEEAMGEAFCMDCYRGEGATVVSVEVDSG